MKKSLVWMLALSLLSGCKPHESSSKKINPEIIGTWQDGNGCNMELSLEQEQLTLVSFSNSHGVNLTNMPLKWYKESVFTKFKTQESTVEFSGGFSDGLILIDNRLCQQPLHKANSR